MGLADAEVLDLKIPSNSFFLANSKQNISFCLLLSEPKQKQHIPGGKSQTHTFAVSSPVRALFSAQLHYGLIAGLKTLKKQSDQGKKTTLLLPSMGRGNCSGSLSCAEVTPVSLQASKSCLGRLNSEPICSALSGTAEIPPRTGWRMLPGKEQLGHSSSQPPCASRRGSALTRRFLSVPSESSRSLSRCLSSASAAQPAAGTLPGTAKGEGGMGATKEHWQDECRVHTAQICRGMERNGAHRGARSTAVTSGRNPRGTGAGPRRVSSVQSTLLSAAGQTAPRHCSSSATEMAKTC